MTGARQVKLSHTYAVAAPSTGTAALEQRHGGGAGRTARPGEHDTRTECPPDDPDERLERLADDGDLADRAEEELDRLEEMAEPAGVVGGDRWTIWIAPAAASS